jgi:hypothetical protein
MPGIESISRSDEWGEKPMSWSVLAYLREEEEKERRGEGEKKRRRREGEKQRIKRLIRGVRQIIPYTNWYSSIHNPPHYN